MEFATDRTAQRRRRTRCIGFRQVVFHQEGLSVELRVSFNLKGGSAALAEMETAISTLCTLGVNDVQTRVYPYLFGPTVTSSLYGVVVLNAELILIGTRSLDSLSVLMQGTTSRKVLQL